MPIAQLVTRLWYHLGYRYKTMEQDTALQYAPLYDKLFHLAAQADAKGDSLAAFVQALQQQVDSAADELIKAQLQSQLTQVQSSLSDKMRENLTLQLRIAQAETSVQTAKADGSRPEPGRAGGGDG